MFGIGTMPCAARLVAAWKRFAFRRRFIDAVLLEQVRVKRIEYRPWEDCQDAPWPKSSRRCDETGRIVGKTHGTHEGHWALVESNIIGQYVTQKEAQDAVDRKLQT